MQNIFITFKTRDNSHCCQQYISHLQLKPGYVDTHQIIIDLLFD